jgi:hypothetical protein
MAFSFFFIVFNASYFGNVEESSPKQRALFSRFNNYYVEYYKNDANPDSPRFCEGFTDSRRQGAGENDRFTRTRVQNRDIPQLSMSFV